MRNPPEETCEVRKKLIKRTSLTSCASVWQQVECPRPI
jgi:hypothetical protein